MAQTEPRFSPGRRVVDADADDPDPMRILGYAKAPNGQLMLAPVYEINAEGRSVADVNDDEYRHDVVAEVVYEQWLNDYISTEWGDWVDDQFGRRVESYCREWGISVDAGVYGFPDGRLASIPEDDDGDEDEHGGFEA